MSKPTPSNKILITLMFWEGDKNQALKLARLLADLEPGHSNLADFLFVSRFDCSLDEATSKYVSRKFNVYNYRSKRRGVGWPNGCSSLFFGAFEFIYHKMVAGQIPHYKAVLVLGPDSAPLISGWLPRIHAAWEKANAKKQICMAGAKLVAGDREHINGDCAVLSTDLKFLKWLVLGVTDVNAGWDWVLADEFHRRGWADFPFIKSLWRKQTITEAEWDLARSRGIEWVHGVKDDSLLEISRRKLI